MPDNPFTAPPVESEVDQPGSHTSPSANLGETAKRVFLAWEKLRIVYLGLLSIFTFLITFPELANPPIVWQVVEGAIAANVLYFAGPAAETYVSWLGYRQMWVRWCLFVGGVLLTMALAFVTLAPLLLPAPN